MENKENPPKKGDGIDSFLSAIGDTLKTFDAYSLNLVKSKIFEVVQEMELKVLLKRENSSVKNEINTPQEQPSGKLSPKIEVFDED